MTASEHLRAILDDINSEARLVSGSGTIYRNGRHVPCTHIVIDADDETLGAGVDENSAMADAITREFRSKREQLERCRTAVSAYRKARLDLDNL